MSGTLPSFFSLGVDPDTYNTGIALVHHTMAGAQLHDKWCAVADKGRTAHERHLKMSQAITDVLRIAFEHYQPLVVAIEWQGIRPGDPAPDDICQLNAVAGIVLGACRMLESKHQQIRFYLPLPVSWKGSVPKIVHQPRILKALMLQRGFSGLGAKESHVIDAAGLALWAGKEELTRMAIARATGGT